MRTFLAHFFILDLLNGYFYDPMLLHFSMPSKKAVEIFNKTNLNCAQSVLKAFQEQENISDLQIIEAKKLGGGRAENGICGALQAALDLTNIQQEKNLIREGFEQQTGSEKCKEIRKLNKTSCSDCVKIAAHLVASKKSKGTEAKKSQ